MSYEETHRKVYLIGDIDHETCKQVFEDISNFENENLDPITIELVSSGGDGYIALGIANRIRSSKCKINVCAYGLVASAAVLILAAGHKRYMSEDSWVMTHEEQLSKNDVVGSVTQAEKAMLHYRQLESQWNKLMQKYTGVSAQTWSTMNLDDTYLAAEECLTYGLIDEILRSDNVAF